MVAHGLLSGAQDVLSTRIQNKNTGEATRLRRGLPTSQNQESSIRYYPTYLRYPISRIQRILWYTRSPSQVHVQHDAQRQILVPGSAGLPYRSRLLTQLHYPLFIH